MRTSYLLTSAIGLLVTLVSAQTPPDFTPSSSTLLPALYGSTTVTPGLKLAQNAVTVPPIITFPNPSSLVLILDLDAPFGSLNRTYSPILHYMALSTSTSNTTAIASYIPPKPPAGSPDHRYVILAYTLSSDSPVPFVLPKAFEKVQSGIEGRVLFDIKGFVEAVSLEELVAANWFLVGSAAGGNGTTSVPGNGTKSEPEPYTSMAVRMNSMALTGLMAVVAGMMALL